MANLLSWMLHSVQHDGLECVPLLSRRTVAIESYQKKGTFKCNTLTNAKLRVLELDKHKILRYL